MRIIFCLCLFFINSCQSLRYQYFNPCNSVYSLQLQQTSLTIQPHFNITKQLLEYFRHDGVLDVFDMHRIVDLFSKRKLSVSMFIYELQLYHGILLQNVPKQYLHNNVLYNEIVETRCLMQDFTFNIIPLKLIKRLHLNLSMSPQLILNIIHQYFYNQLSHTRIRKVRVKNTKKSYFYYKNKLKQFLIKYNL